MTENFLLRDELAAIIAEEMASIPNKDEAAATLPVLEQSPKARAIRRIAEIVNFHGWQIEVTRALDRHAASYVDDLPQDAVLALRDRMEHLEECAQYGCDPEDALPAR
jgi:hypothetical protein